MEVHAKVDEADIGQIRLGQQASFTVDAYPGRAFRGTVMQIRKAPQLVQNVVTYTVVLSARNADLALLPGMTAIVQHRGRRGRGRAESAQCGAALSAARRQWRGRGRGRRGAGAGGRPPWSGSRAMTARRVPVRVTLGRSNESATGLVDGPLRAGQPVIVGTASTPQDHSWFGFSWRP